MIISLHGAFHSERLTYLLFQLDLFFYNYIGCAIVLEHSWEFRHERCSFSYLLVYSSFFLASLSDTYKHSHTHYSNENLQPPERIVAPFSVWPLGNRAPCFTCTLSRHHPEIRYRHCRYAEVDASNSMCIWNPNKGAGRLSIGPDGCGISLLRLTLLSFSFSLLFFLRTPVYTQVVPATKPFSLFPVLSLFPFPADHV